MRNTSPHDQSKPRVASSWGALKRGRLIQGKNMNKEADCRLCVYGFYFPYHDVSWCLYRAGKRSLSRQRKENREGLKCRELVANVESSRVLNWRCLPFVAILEAIPCDDRVSHFSFYHQRTSQNREMALTIYNSVIVFSWGKTEEMSKW